jgi:tripartite-type tricarboxylate transporter receptor subunit TctC
MAMLKSIALAIIAGASVMTSAGAQTFPDHTIRIIVPQPPGGGFDTVARVMADPLSAILGQPVIVENKPGSGTLVGTDFAAKAAPDGYTLLLGGTSNMALNQGLYPKISYDPVKDFTPVGLVVSWPFMVITRKDLPYKTFKELIDAARAKPDAITYASAGVGSGQHVATAVMAYLAGVKMLHVPYSGAQAAYGDLLGGRVDIFSDNAQTAMAQVKGDTVRALAVTTAKRYAGLPDLPSAMETGLSSIDMETWFGLFAPSGTPAPVLAKLTEAVAKARSDPRTIDLFNKTGGTLKTMSNAEEKAFAKSESDRWTKLLRDAGIRAE